MKTKLKRSMKVVIACVVIFTLVLSSLLISTNHKTANADSSTVSNYLEAKAYLSSVRSEYNAIMSEATSIYNQIEATTQKAFEAQRAMTESQLHLNSLLKYQYENSTIFSIFIMIACSTSLDDFSKNIDYANSAMDYLLNVSKDNKEKKDAFDNTLQNLNSQNAAQNECLASASGKLAEAETVLQGIRSKLTPEELAELEGEISDIGGGGSGGGGGEGGGGDTPTPGPTPPGPQPGPSPDPPTPAWSSGLASAYGGSSDPYTPNPGTTATGEVCDDWSTGVAVPMA